MGKSSNQAAENLRAFRRQFQIGNHRDDLLFARYGELYIEQTAAGIMDAFGPEKLESFLHERYEYFTKRRSGAFALRVQPLSRHFTGNSAPATMIEIVAGDRPFLVDSLQAYLVSRGIQVRGVLHPIICVNRESGVNRESARKISSLNSRGGQGHPVAHILIVAEFGGGQESNAELAAGCRAIIQQVVRCVDDFPQMQRQLAGLAKDIAVRDKSGGAAVELIEWFQDHNFLFLGSLSFEFSRLAKPLKPQWSAGLGLFRTRAFSPEQGQALRDLASTCLAKLNAAKPHVIVQETEVSAGVHRRDPLSSILVTCPSDGKRCRGAMIVGLFTNRSFRESALTIPLIREKVNAVIEKKHLFKNSHAYKELVDYFDGVPKFQLFGLPVKVLEETADFVLELIDQSGARIEILTDKAAGLSHIMAAEIGEMRDPALVARIQNRLDAIFGGPPASLFTVPLNTFAVHHLSYQQDGSAVRLPRDAAIVTQAVWETLQSREAMLLEAWRDEAEAGLDETLAQRLIAGLPEEYRVSHDDEEILADLAWLAKMHTRGEPQLVLRPAGGDGVVKMVLYGLEEYSLSRIMPILTNLRVEVLQERSYRLSEGPHAAFLQTFYLRSPESYALSSIKHQQSLSELILGILHGRLENDPLNALLITCDFGWRPINLMMLLRDYLMQVGTVYTRRTIDETLVRRSGATRALYAMFCSLFDPGLKPDQREAGERATGKALFATLQEIDNLTEDRIFKRMHNLVKSTVRTNYFRDPGNPVLAIKLRCAAVDDLPLPHPMYEIFVHGPHILGTHLRNGMIARGGIRYSDRPDDFRTEILGLMATQVKKNAIIVPNGAKGGFVVKDLAPWNGNVRAAGDAQYCEFIRALLSITDNMKGARVVPPERVVRHDGDDPYLVVAADKGTAHLSDTANGISVDQGFWLGDAFASGGSQGYDHKIVGITARGTWESVSHHFWALGINVQKEPVRVLGIGDMSGDVFGNGMLCSRAIKLVAAFNHRHILLDPDPHPARSYKERRRLFRLRGSSWCDYDAKAISTGGGVYSRNAKAIPLSPQVRTMLNTGVTEMTGEELIRALLSMEVDLLWNGGIGTYVKSSAENHADAGDTTNDTVRVDAGDVRVRVIGEGGNLGITQRARIELDRQGTLVNSDAIDNSGGVDMSDHEVNLKILMRELMNSGAIPDRAARNALVRSLELEVTEDCLHDNALQTMVLSMDHERSRIDMQPFLRLMEKLTAEGKLDPQTEHIPPAPYFAQLKSQRAGIPRPILAVLMAYTKIALFDRLEASPLLDDPYLAGHFERYFPDSLLKKHPLKDTHHPLKRQIIGTVLANQVVNQAGMTFIHDTAAFTGKEWWQVVQAYVLADEIVQGRALRDAVYGSNLVLPAELGLSLLAKLEAVLANVTQWMLLHLPHRRRTFSLIAETGAAMAKFKNGLAGSLAADLHKVMESQSRELRKAGMPPEAALFASHLPHMGRFMEFYHLVTTGKLKAASALTLISQVEKHFQFDRLHQALVEMSLVDAWQIEFADTLRHKLTRAYQSKLDAILSHCANRRPADLVGDYLAGKESTWNAYRTALASLLEQKLPGLVSLGVVVDRLDRI